MTISKTTAAAAISSVLLLACAGEDKPEGVIPEGYRSAIDKAESVEGKLGDAMQLRGEEIEEGEH